MDLVFVSVFIIDCCPVLWGICGNVEIGSGSIGCNVFLKKILQCSSAFSNFQKLSQVIPSRDDKLLDAQTQSKLLQRFNTLLCRLRRTWNSAWKLGVFEKIRLSSVRTYVWTYRRTYSSTTDPISKRTSVSGIRYPKDQQHEEDAGYDDTRYDTTCGSQRTRCSFSRFHFLVAVLAGIQLYAILIYPITGLTTSSIYKFEI